MSSDSFKQAGQVVGGIARCEQSLASQVSSFCLIVKKCEATDLALLNFTEERMGDILSFFYAYMAVGKYEFQRLVSVRYLQIPNVDSVQSGP